MDMDLPVTCKFTNGDLLNYRLIEFRFHMHGNGFAYQGFNQYAESINDGVGKTLYMKAVDQGMWQVICHVQNHNTMGMVANYRVFAKGKCPLPPLKPL